MKLNKKQRGYAEFRRDQYKSEAAEIMQRLAAKHEVRPGRLAEQLGWDVDCLMECDLLHDHWQNLLDQADNPKNENTLEGLFAYLLRQLRDTRPPGGGGAEGRRLLDRTTHSALAQFLNDLDGGTLCTGLMDMED